MLANHTTIFFCPDISGHIVDLTVLHVAFILTANRKPPLFPTLPAAPGESSLTACQVEELTTKSTAGAALEGRECIDNIMKVCLELAELGGIKINIIITVTVL